jgi:hypothetical protein
MGCEESHPMVQLRQIPEPLSHKQIVPGSLRLESPTICDQFSYLMYEHMVPAPDQSPHDWFRSKRGKMGVSRNVIGGMTFRRLTLSR